jgi:hypothetical protein
MAPVNSLRSLAHMSHTGSVGPTHRDVRRLSFVKPCPAAWAEPSPLTRSGSQSLSSRAVVDWRVDTLIALTDLRKVDIDMERRRVLVAATYGDRHAPCLPVGLPVVATRQRATPLDSARSGSGLDLVIIPSRTSVARTISHCLPAVIVSSPLTPKEEQPVERQVCRAQGAAPATSPANSQCFLS